MTAIGWSRSHGNGNGTALGRAWLLPSVLAGALGLYLAFVQGAAAAPEPFTWSGEASSPSYQWSLSSNWAGDVAPGNAGEISTLTFPRLERPACEAAKPSEACYVSENVVGGLNVGKMQLDDGDRYLIFGEEITLADGGLVAAPANGSSGPGGALLATPIDLSTPQRWSISQRSGGGYGEDEVVLFGDVLGSPLAVEMSNGPFLVLVDDIEVGKLEFNGASLAGKRLANGDVFLEEAELNAEDDEPVEVSHVVVQGSGATGPLQTNDAAVNVGSGFSPAGGITAASVKLDGASQLNFAITNSGAVAQEDYSQLVVRL